ncbi:bifunctional Ribosomal protein L21-like/L21-like superfamily [Babesia duncani]|uniref:Bifunctional Ribosomal protein L21-like/L21-like superfamily n=1 Tax=Babesia duncani TaxID=323732 RepID=A0AAD9PM81_9APIC|nr:bifunctional Ribosomal protein L21-like/L21-like superfamily [Babesia duncani]
MYKRLPWIVFLVISGAFRIAPTTNKIGRLCALIARPAQERLAKLDDGKDRSGSYAIVHISGVPRWVERGRYYDVYRLQQSPGAKVHLTRVAFFQSPEGCKEALQEKVWASTGND